MGFTLPIPPDTALITDDGCITGLALVNTTTGVIIGFTDVADFACGSESGIVMLDGTIATPNNTGFGFGNGNVSIYNNNLELITAIVLGTPPNAAVSGFASDRITYFYVTVAGVADALTVYKIDKLGITIQSWSLGVSSSSDPLPCAVTRTNTFFYFYNAGQIKQLDLSTGLVTNVFAISGVTWLGIDTSDNIYIYRLIANVIEKYDLATFTLAGSVDAGPATYTVDVAHFSADDAHLFAWTQKDSGAGPPIDKLSNFRKIKLSDLSIISDASDIPTSSNSNDIVPGSSISNSCPLLISAGPSSNEGRDDCGGGSLVGGGTPGGGGDSGCNSCDPDTVPPPANWPAPLLSDLMSVGINNCWDITFIYAVEPLFNARGFTGQVNSSGALRGRFYQGFPVPDFDKYFDTNGPTCGWLYSPHGITII